MKIQHIASIISISLAFAFVGVAQADDRADPASANGFYGGISLRDNATEGTALTFGSTNAVWNRYTTAAADDTASRALVFGGYRWRNDLAVEASFSSMDKYALRPFDAAGVRRGVGLTFGSSAGLADLPTRSWNVDLFTSWTFYRSLALYGRLGYGQSEVAPLFGVSPPALSDSRRLRDGVNYGIGMRYDMNSALGLRVEYGRFGRFAGEIGSGLPESDQVNVGLQLRF